MEKINFIKMHGLGNDFVIIDNRQNDLIINNNLINKLSDRKTGAGCDQLIVINATKEINIQAKIEIFNPNGDRAEACGNGTRCVAKLLFKESGRDELQIQSDAGILHAKKIDSKNISVNLGKLSTKWQVIPLSRDIDTLNIPINIDGFSNGVAVNIGNPHIIFFGKNINDVDLESIGSEIEHHELFPEKTNVEIVEIINKNTIKMRVWERGAGLTLACGSGACASVFAGHIKNLLDNNVEVQLERGSLFINIKNNEAIMQGPAEISFHGTLEV
ncbi:diaminopimelate epimerase [Alphaproteobacteria bacterium]|nr:diaminopimelate epimerase [Alphaproteobacteria bacterium]